MKIQVTKGIFEALNNVMNRYPKDEIMDLHSTKTEEDDWRGDWSPLNELSITEMAKALYVGYEVKKEPMEAIRDYYALALHFSETGDYEMKAEANAKIEAVEFVLEELGINLNKIDN